jgi:C-terminal processing protease CtpA/Prc
LGGKVISRFNLIIDYSSSLLYLKPNNKFGESFEFPLSGIRLKKVDNSIIIDRIEKTSSAYKKGIRKGDKLISINKDSSGDIENYRELLRNEGEKVSLVIINSGGKTKKIKIKLTRLL